MTASDLPDRQEAVRRALAAARHTDPMPADVAARLGAVLAEQEPLADPGPAPDQPAPPPGPQRRQPRRTMLLAAAAAVVVAGVGLSAVGGLGGALTESGSDTAASTLAEEERADGGTVPQDADRPDPTGSDLSTQESWPRPVVRPRHLEADIRAATRLSGYQHNEVQANDAVEPDLPASPEALNLGLDTTPIPNCGQWPAADVDQVIGIRWRGQEANLVLRAPADGFQRAEIHTCTPPRSVRHAQIPVLP